MPPSARATLASLREIAATPGGDPRAAAKVKEYETIVANEDAELERQEREKEDARLAARARVLGGQAEGIASNAPAR